MFLVDKYNSNDNYILYRSKIIETIRNLSKDTDEIPGIIFYGPDETENIKIAYLFLEMIYGKSVYKTNETKYIVSNNNINSEISIKQSNFHMVIQPDNNGSDKNKFLVIKEYAKKIPLSFIKTDKKFKIVLINNANNLSYYAQTSLRRTIEIYAKNCRFLMISNSLSKIIDPLKSRCICIRIPRPTTTEIFNVLYNISLKEDMNLDLDKFYEIKNKNNRDIKKSIWELDYIKYNIKEENSFLDRIELICKYIIKNNIEDLIIIRSILYNILITNISEIDILKSILKTLLKENISNKKKYKIIKLSSDIDFKLINSRHLIYHLEKFITNIFCIINED